MFLIMSWVIAKQNQNYLDPPARPEQIKDNMLRRMSFPKVTQEVI